MKDKIFFILRWILVLPAYFIGWFLTFKVFLALNTLTATLRPFDIGIKGLPYYFAYIGAVVGGLEAMALIAPIEKNKAKLIASGILLVLSLYGILEIFISPGSSPLKGPIPIKIAFAGGEWLVILVYTLCTWNNGKVLKSIN